MDVLGSHGAMPENVQIGIKQQTIHGSFGCRFLLFAFFNTVVYGIIEPDDKNSQG
jgi:hypothetical protein